MDKKERAEVVAGEKEELSKSGPPGLTLLAYIKIPERGGFKTKWQDPGHRLDLSVILVS